MSETPAGTDKIVIHGSGHLKRIDTSTLEKGDYAYSIDNGNISIKQIDSSVTTSSFKDKDGKILVPTQPFIAINQNKDGFTKLSLPQTQDKVCGVVNKGATGFICQDITGVNVITQQYNLTSPTDSSIYCYDKVAKGWKALSFAAGPYFLQADSSGLNPVKLTPVNLYRHAFGIPVNSNMFTIQYNKGEIHQVVVPSTQGNYCLSVDNSGNVSFGQGEITSRLCVTYNLSAKEGQNPTLSDHIMVSSGDEKIQFDSTYKLKTDTRFFVDGKFTFIVNDTSVFDNMIKPAKMTLKLGSDNTNIVDTQYIYHPESGILELHFSGICKPLITETPQIVLEGDETFTAINVNLSFADRTNLATITFIEV